MFKSEVVRIRLVIALIVTGLMTGTLMLTKSWRALGSHPMEVKNSSEANMAPEFASGTWINSDPLTIKNLQGHVVVVEFWTFGCYNCRNTLPFVKSWHERYASKGLTIVGVHSPEMDAEYQIEN